MRYVEESVGHLETPAGYRLRTIVLLVGATLGLSAAIAGVSHYENGVKDKASAAREEQARETEAMQEQQARQARDVEAQKQAIQEQAKRQQQVEAENAEEARERSLPCEGVEHCVTITVLQAASVVLTTTDANGYRQHESAPLQHLLVSVDRQKKGYGIMLNGRLFDGNGATADLLCLQSCLDFEVGSTHYVGMGRWRTHWHACTDGMGECYDNLPYLSIGNAKWQVLELCSGRPGERCEEMSTVNSRE
jgi:hypothetical protein